MSSLPSRYKFSVLLILLLMPMSIIMHKGLLVVLSRHTDIFKIKHIDLIGASYSLDPHFQETLDGLYDKSLFSLNIFDVKQTLIRGELIDEVSISRKFPDRIRIEITEKQPVAIVRSDSKQYIVDPAGKILPLVASNLPSVRVDYGIIMSSNQISDEYLVQVLDALNQAPEVEVESVYINRNRETSFRLKGLSSEFLIAKRVLSAEFIQKAALVAKTITNQNIPAPKKIDIHNHEKNAVGFF
ncbi:MAG: cell division protein FtsQ/DivIB [Brevinema sp.]